MNDTTIGEVPAIPLSPDRPTSGANASFAPIGRQTQTLAVTAAETASKVADQAKQKMTGSLDGQKAVVADMVEKLAQTVHRSGEQLRGQQDWIASAIGRGAAELDTFAGALRSKDLSDLAGEMQSFAKRQPAMFMGTALVAGFALARLGKLVAGDLSRDDLPTMPEVGNGQH